ncbi:hypothetical protein CHS0354_014399 [Potamilus streckersoni]|uniref:Uncharacterized protein n=1 Tax=Potamilus streckersoni TaxID=2493646 RepID=A0AAE0SAG8_9BIVA|nr:hypothetical protein CHS0354_014399 [Potamilus streckersoni]
MRIILGRKEVLVVFNGRSLIRVFIQMMSSSQSAITRCIFLSLICVLLLLPSVSAQAAGPPSPRCIYLPEHGACVPRCVLRPDLPVVSKRIRECDETVLICQDERCGCIVKNLLETIYL